MFVSTKENLKPGLSLRGFLTLAEEAFVQAGQCRIPELHVA